MAWYGVVIIGLLCIILGFVFGLWFYAKKLDKAEVINNENVEIGNIKQKNRDSSGNVISDLMGRLRVRRELKRQALEK